MLELTRMPLTLVVIMEAAAALPGLTRRPLTPGCGHEDATGLDVAPDEDALTVVC